MSYDSSVGFDLLDLLEMIDDRLDVVLKISKMHATNATGKVDYQSVVKSSDVVLEDDPIAIVQICAHKTRHHLFNWKVQDLVLEIVTHVDDSLNIWYHVNEGVAPVHISDQF